MSEIKRPDVTRYRLTVRGDSGEMLELITGEVSTNAGKVTVPLTWRDTASIDIEWTRDEPHHADRSKWSGKHHPPKPGALDDDSVIAAWSERDRLHHNGHYGVPAGECSGPPECDRWHVCERHAAQHHKGHYGAPDPDDGGPQGCIDHEVNQLSCEMCGSIRKRYYDRIAQHHSDGAAQPFVPSGSTCTVHPNGCPEHHSADYVVAGTETYACPVCGDDISQGEIHGCPGGAR